MLICISTRSAVKVMSLKGDFTFHFLNILIIDLCDSPANSLLEIL